MQLLADGLAKVIRYYRRRSKARQLLIHLNEWREKGKILAFRYAVPRIGRPIQFAGTS